jgi:hypothetical protein
MVHILSNREYPLERTCEDLGTIRDMAEPPHRIRLESGHNVLKYPVFGIPNNVIRMDNEIVKKRVRQGLSKPAWGIYRNAHFLVPKKIGRYYFIISAISGNRYALEDARIPANLDEVSQAFAGLPVSSLINFQAG